MVSALWLGAVLATSFASVDATPTRATSPRSDFVKRANLPVTLALTAPSTKQTLAHNLVGLSLEGDRWPDWAGSRGRPNSFFVNTLTNLGKLTGHLPDVRVGANSEDHTQVVPRTDVISAVFPNYTAITPYPEATAINISDAYYELSANMPFGTHMTWGVNLGSNSTANAVLMAKGISEQFRFPGAAWLKGITLDAIEIGNEVDLYHTNGLRAKNWTFAEWTAQWETFAKDVIVAARLIPNFGTKLLAGSFSGTTHTSTGFSPQGLIADGILSGKWGEYIDIVSQHCYSGSFCTGSGALLQALMNKASIRGNITQYNADIAAVHAAGKRYIFGETNSYSCHGAPGVADTAGAAIWALDYVLQAASRGIEKVWFHQGIGFKYNMIQPIALTRSIETGAPLSTPLPAHVMPTYYAAVIVGWFTGNTRNPSTYLTELTVNSANVAGYAAYEHNKLVRAVFINSIAWLSTNTGVRGSSQLGLTVGNVTLSAGQAVPKTMQVRRLSITHADDQSGVMISFAGVTYETPNGLPSGTDTFTTQDFNSTLFVYDTEAVLVSFVY